MSPRSIDHCPARALCTDRPKEVGETSLSRNSVTHKPKLRLISPSCEASTSGQGSLSAKSGCAAANSSRAERPSRRRCMAGRKSTFGGVSGKSAAFKRPDAHAAQSSPVCRRVEAACQLWMEKRRRKSALMVFR